MSYTKFIMQDAVCNYLNAEVDKSEKMLLSCINYDKFPLESIPVDITKGTCNGQEIVEGFSSDMGSMGVTYPPENKEPDYNEGTLDKICRSSFNCDLTGARPIYEKPYDVCGDNQEFVGINLDGKVICKDTSPQNMTYAADAEMKESSPLDDIA